MFSFFRILGNWRKCMVIALCWLLGLFFGSFFAAGLDASSLSVMRLISFDSVSIIGITVAVSFPFLISAFLAFLSLHQFLLPLCFLNAFAFSLLGQCIYLAYGSAGWLIRFLIQFPHILTAPLFCWFCIRHSFGRGGYLKRDFLICMVGCTVGILLDYFMISPFLARLLEI